MDPPQPPAGELPPAAQTPLTADAVQGEPMEIQT